MTPPEKRAQAFGMIGMAFGIGFVVAPAIGGFLGEINVRLPFWAAVVMCLTNFVYGLFVLPESLPTEKRTPHFDWAHANPFGALKLLRRYPQVLGLIGVLFLMALAHMVYPTTFVLYADYRFGWGPQMVGYTLAARRRARRDRAGRPDQEDRRRARRTPRAVVRPGLRHARLRVVRRSRRPATGSGRRCRSPRSGASPARPRRRS